MTDGCMGCRVPGYSHAAYCPEGRVEDLRSRLAEAERDGGKWREAALRVGESLIDNGPEGYYQMTPEAWLSWALVALKQADSASACTCDGEYKYDGDCPVHGDPSFASDQPDAVVEYESVGWQYKFPAIFGAWTWRDSPDRYNGSDPIESREIFAKRLVVASADQPGVCVKDGGECGLGGYCSEHQPGVTKCNCDDHDARYCVNRIDRGSPCVCPCHGANVTAARSAEATTTGTPHTSPTSTDKSEARDT